MRKELQVHQPDIVMDRNGRILHRIWDPQKREYTFWAKRIDANDAFGAGPPKRPQSTIQPSRRKPHLKVLTDTV